MTSLCNYPGTILTMTDWRYILPESVTLNGVSASGNLGDGADIYAWNSTISVKNSVFDNNELPWGDGAVD